MTPTEPPDPSVVAMWGAFITGIVGVVAVALSKTLGGIGDTRRVWRAMRKEKEDARVDDLTGDIQHLRGRVNYLVDESEHMWRMIHAHRPWDHRAAEIIRSLAPHTEMDPPPPLIPRSPIAAEASSAIAAAEVHEAINTIEAKATMNTPPRGLKLPDGIDEDPHKGRNT